MAVPSVDDLGRPGAAGSGPGVRVRLVLSLGRAPWRPKRARHRQLPEDARDGLLQNGLKSHPLPIARPQRSASPTAIGRPDLQLPHVPLRSPAPTAVASGPSCIDSGGSAGLLGRAPHLPRAHETGLVPRPGTRPDLAARRILRRRSASHPMARKPRSEASSNRGDLPEPPVRRAVEARPAGRVVPVGATASGPSYVGSRNTTTYVLAHRRSQFDSGTHPRMSCSRTERSFA